ELSLAFSGDWHRHHLQIEAAHELSPIELEEVLRGEAQAQRVVQRQKLGTGSVAVQLDLTGALTLDEAKNSSLPFDRWQGQLNQLEVQHAAFAIKAQNAVPLTFLFDRP